MKNIHDWNLIQTNKTGGTFKMKCPICSGSRNNKLDKSLSVNMTSGFAKCHYPKCDALFFRDKIEKTILSTSYALPKQDWSNYTNLSEKLVKWAENKRKLHQFTLIHFGITEEMYYQPQLGKEVNNIVFNFFEGNTVVNKKYRSGDKKFTQSKNGKPILYNINAAIGQEELYILEGELEVLSLYEIGIKNAVSLPSGANDNDAYWINSEKYLKDVKKFYIATDNDAAGNAVAEKIAQRLGRYRCERVIFEGKDANEDLVNGVLEKSIHNKQKYPVSGTFTSSDLLDKMLSLYDKGNPDTLRVKNKAFGELNNVLQLMLGHLCVSTGIPSHGKSNFTEWLVLNYLLEYDLKASFFSPEHQPLERHMSTFAEKIIGKNYYFEIDSTPRISKLELMQFSEWANQKLYLTSPDNGEFANWDWLFEKFKEQLFNFGINIFVIDAFNKVEHTGNRTERENIAKVLSRLTQFAQQNNVLIILVAHPTKMRKENGIYEIPTLYDVSGSADFRNQTHDGFCIYRYFGDEKYTVFHNLKCKYKFQGEIGKFVEYDYHIPSGRYYPRGSQVQDWNLLESLNEIILPLEKETIDYSIPRTSLLDAFGNAYDDNIEVPF